MTGKRKYTKVFFFFFILSICITAFIWHNSLLDADNSERASLGIVVALQRVLAWINVQVSTGRLDHIIRKIAHLTEFTALGFCLLALFWQFTHGLKGRSLNFTFLFGLLIAGVDETLQLFSAGRSCQLSDVGIDFTGVVLGACISLLVHKLHSKPDF